jgi:tyrosine-protein phosphatase SIW14
MPRFLKWVFGLLIAALVIGGPIGYAHYLRANFRNFRVVHEDVLCRSGQMSLPALQQVVRDHGIKTVITLRDSYRPGEPPPDLAEEKWCQAQDILHIRIPPRYWEAADNSVPAEEGVLKFLEIMDDPKNHPVLIHCFAGSHRTGAYCAVYRMEYEHWSNADAIDEVKEFGYIRLDEEVDILGYLERYQPRWKGETRAQTSR